MRALPLWKSKLEIELFVSQSAKWVMELDQNLLTTLNITFLPKLEIVLHKQRKFYVLFEIEMST